MRWIIGAALLASAGCMVTEYRQQAVEYSLARTARARDGIAAAADAGRQVAEEIAAAAAQERPVDVARPLEALAASLSVAHASAEEAGKTLAVVQEDLGRPQTPAPIDPQAAEALRMQYRAASRLWKMAVSWAKSSLPAPVQGMIKSPASTGGGWSATGIAGVITAITAALAGAGEATRRGVKSMRRRQAEREVERDRELEAAHAEAEEAMQALDEVKSRHPQTVKAATDRKKRPNLRRAYVRRETADAVGSEA
jgi:hypothetical protein